jgi:UDP-glucose 4-epimerase
MVVGATGLVGSHLVTALRRECIVHSVARSDTGSREHAAEHHTVDFTSDLSTAELPEEIDAVVYLAQSNRFRDMPEQAVHVFTVNTAAVVAMMDYARQAGARKFIFASTGGVYPAGGMTCSEQMPVYASAARDYYSATKLCSEILLEAMADQVELTILRIFFAYGRGQREEMLLPRLVSRVRSGVPITLRGRDGFSLNPVHVSDVVGAIRAALSLSGSHTVNVAGPKVYTLRQITAAIGERLGQEPVFDVQEDDAEPVAIVGDISLMSQLLTPPRRTFMEGLEDLL